VKRHSYLVTLSLIVGAVVLTAACESGNGSPTAPSAASPTLLGQGATIQGRVNSGGPGNGSLLSAQAAGMRVEVIGSTLGTSVDAGGQFTLNDVRPGQVQLRFIDAGNEATVDVGIVRAGERVSIAVTVVGSQAVLDSRSSSTDDDSSGSIEDDSSNNNGDEDVHPTGTVQNFDRSQCDSVTFEVVNPTRPTETVFTTPDTIFDDGGCQAMNNGDFVRIDGVREGNRVRATEIEVDRVAGRPGDDDIPDDNGEDDEGEAHPEGVLSGLRGTCPEVTFDVNGMTVHTTASTVFDDGGCPALANGDQVRVDGFRQADGSVRATEVEVDEPDDGADDDDADRQDDASALTVEVRPDEWRLEWAEGSHSGSGGDTLRIRIRGSGAHRIRPASITLSGPGGSIEPVSTDADDDFEAEFSKVEAISLVGSAQPGDSVTIVVGGALQDGTPIDLSQRVRVRS